MGAFIDDSARPAHGWMRMADRQQQLLDNWQRAAREAAYYLYRRDCYPISLSVTLDLD